MPVSRQDETDNILAGSVIICDKFEAHRATYGECLVNKQTSHVVPMCQSETDDPFKQASSTEAAEWPAMFALFLAINLKS